MSGRQRYLVTGFSGFVSSHLLDSLEQSGAACDILGLDLAPPAWDWRRKKLGIEFKKIDLTDAQAIDAAVRSFRPDHIVHLASFSSVAHSWREPIGCFLNNTNIFLNLAEAVRKEKVGCRILSVGSSEEYGNVSPADLPLREDMPLRPVSPYAVARVSQEMLSRVYVDSYGLDIVMTRSFNHIGPRQTDRFVIPSFARQLVAVKKAGLANGVLKTGDTGIVRDFLDVRDVVRAYRMLLESGKKGEVYNVAGGSGRSLAELIGLMSGLLGINVSTETDEELLRPSENRAVIGDIGKIFAAVGWRPEIELKRSLADLLDYWMHQ